MDHVLVPYLTAPDEEDRQRHLDELLTIRAAPLIRQVLRRRLGFYVSAQGTNENNQDAEDLYQEAMTRVVQVLHQLQSSPGSNPEFGRSPWTNRTDAPLRVQPLQAFVGAADPPVDA